METTSTEYHNKISKTYDEGYKAPYWKVYNELTWSYIKECLPSDKNNTHILDAGGGTGLWAIRIAEAGYNVTLTDISKGMLDVAKEKIKDKKLENKIKIEVTDITNMKEFKENTFDLSLAEGDPVSYCNNPQKAISELSRVTKTGGYITVSVDNKLNWAAGYIGKGEFKKAEEILKSGIGNMWDRETDQTYPAFMFTIEELKELYIQNNIEPTKAIGKTVFIKNFDSLNDEKILNKYLEFEIKYSSLPSVAGRGGHIALVGRKR